MGGAKRKGFALLEILIVVVIIALLAGGGLYFKYAANERSAATSAASDEQQAQAVVQEVNSTTVQEQNMFDQVSGQTTSSVAIVATGSSTATVSATDVASTSVGVSDPLAGLGSNKYADGILPLGDGKYVTSAPKKGYVYLCNANTDGQGAQNDGPWIGTSTWNINQKIHVQGAISWPNASYSMTVSDGTRTIITNDLPNGVTTGIFPIESTDPAYQYDTNPNTIKAQSLTFNFPAAPTFAAAPSCIGGEVGVMTDGVMLFDAFDAELRDAPAHELQDSCDGHPQEAGEYHYHGPSTCLANNSTTVIGFAFDGFPITGAKISDARYLTTADLDECHGITSPIDLDGETVNMYHYVMTEDFPYSVSCFRGTSTVKGPTVAPTSGGTPPAAAISACSGGLKGSACNVTTPNGSISGTCGTPPGQSTLACIPAGR
jgi:prepilin-type N-terminal cleavage/methylation domain-containing protein